MSCAYHPAADEYAVPDAVAISSGYVSIFSTDATVSLATESIRAAIFSDSSWAFMHKI